MKNDENESLNPLQPRVVARRDFLKGSLAGAAGAAFALSSAEDAFSIGVPAPSKASA
ncbi:MAG: twin-arginine translocation signal domain-containing protein, partial [Terriglobia bacterium]